MTPQITKIKTYLFILAFAFLVQVVFSVLYFRHSNQLYSASLHHIESLISEIGDLKNENQIMGQKIQAEIEFQGINQTFLTDLSQKLTTETGVNTEKALQEYHNFLTKEKEKLEQEKSDLTNQLNQQTEQIDALTEQNLLKKRIEDQKESIQVFLLLGTNQQLTDSIELLFVNSASQKITMVSIPRDLYYDGRKINEYFHLYGPDQLTKILAEITGFPVSHYIDIDFAALTNVIDTLGGLTIDVKKTISDSSYPNGSGGYKTVSFETGIQKMNGTRVLEYARSRKSTSDFDRSLRQQQILIALKEKLHSTSPLENFNFYLALYQNILSYIKTDLNFFQALQYFENYKTYKISAGNILSNENYLYSSHSVSGQSILLPKNGNFTEFQKKILEII